MFQKLNLKIKNNILVIGFLLLGAIAIGSAHFDDKNKIDTTYEKEEKSPDTYIPRGFVLVPLEIANSDSLNALIGDLGGVVDLYLATNSGQKNGLKVGSKLKLLRAPLNPNQYAVLVRESEGSRILSYTGPFVAVIQNPVEQGPKLTSTPSQINIDYQN